MILVTRYQKWQMASEVSSDIDKSRKKLESLEKKKAFFTKVERCVSIKDGLKTVFGGVKVVFQAMKKRKNGSIEYFETTSNDPKTVLKELIGRKKGSFDIRAQIVDFESKELLDEYMWFKATVQPVLNGYRSNPLQPTPRCLLDMAINNIIRSYQFKHENYKDPGTKIPFLDKCIANKEYKGKFVKIYALFVKHVLGVDINDEETWSYYGKEENTLRLSNNIYEEYIDHEDLDEFLQEMGMNKNFLEKEYDSLCKCLVMFSYVA